MGQAEIALRLFHDFAGPSAAMSAEGLAKVRCASCICPMLCLSMLCLSYLPYAVPLVLAPVFSRDSVSVTMRLVAAVSLCVQALTFSWALCFVSSELRSNEAV